MIRPPWRGGTAPDNRKSDEVGFAREKTGSDGPGRPVTDSVGSAPRWTRTINPLIKSPSAKNSKLIQVNGLRRSLHEVAHLLPTDARQGRPSLDLAAVVEAWPHLPEAIRAGILAMVQAANKHRGGT
jgi:hypothetical protein